MPPLSLSLFWHASRRAELRLTGATVRTWTGHETWPTGRAVVIHADPWRLGIRKVRQAIAAAGSPDAGLPNPLDQLDRLARAADGSHERASLTLADDRRAFLGFATLGRRVLPRRDRIDYELDLMFLWVHPAARGQGLGAALAAAIGMTSLADYRAMAVRTAAPLPVATLLFADFLTPSGAATGRRVMHALTEAGLAHVAAAAGGEVTLRVARPRLADEATGILRA